MGRGYSEGAQVALSPSSHSMYGRDVAVVDGDYVAAAVDGLPLRELDKPEDSHERNLILSVVGNRKIQQ